MGSSAAHRRWPHCLQTTDAAPAHHWRSPPVRPLYTALQPRVLCHTHCPTHPALSTHWSCQHPYPSPKQHVFLPTSNIFAWNEFSLPNSLPIPKAQVRGEGEDVGGRGVLDCIDYLSSSHLRGDIWSLKDSTLWDIPWLKLSPGLISPPHADPPGSFPHYLQAPLEKFVPTHPPPRLESYSPVISDSLETSAIQHIGRQQLKSF